MSIRVHTRLNGTTELYLDPHPTLSAPLETNNNPILNSGNPVTITGNEYPVSSGSAGQALITNGSGVLSWETIGQSSTLKLYSENPVLPITPVTPGINAVAVGSGANAAIYGQKAFANGVFNVSGDAQHGVYIVRNITTNNTPLELFLDGPTATRRLILPNNSAFAFDILVVGCRTDGIMQGAAYKFIGVALTASAGTISFIGTPSKTIIGETVSFWDVILSANISDNSIQIIVTGAISSPTNWVATILTRFARKSSPFGGRMDSAEGEAFLALGFGLVRRLRLLNVLANHGNRRTAATSSKITRRP
jgi:hypothetical protein